MQVQNREIDGGRAFDWDRAAADYAKYRDIYPREFYDRILRRGLCVRGQRVLDLGTGTGVLPRNLYPYGAQWTGVDSAPEQIEQAKRLSAGMDISYFPAAAEEIDFPADSFEVVTACQCFWYFDHTRLLPRLVRVLRPGGRLLLLYMAWLPLEDEIAGASERLVLRFNPQWSGAGERIRPIAIPDGYQTQFQLIASETFALDVRFTRQSWHGRMKACRGVGASLSPPELAAWEREHLRLLGDIAPDAFAVKHYGALAELRVVK